MSIGISQEIMLQLSNQELEAFKKDYSGHVGGKYNLKIQVPHLEKLADRYLQRYVAFGQWTDALKVNVCDLSCLHTYMFPADRNM